MSRRSNAIVSAIFSLIVFTVIPLYAPTMLPEEMLKPLIDSGVDLYSFTSQIAILGVFATILTVIKGFFDIASYAYIVTALTSNIVTIYFTLTTLTMGNVGSFGITKITMDIQGGSSTLIMDMSVFVWLTLITLGLQIIINILNFIEAKKLKTSRIKAEHLVFDSQIQEKQEIHEINNR